MTDEDIKAQQGVTDEDIWLDGQECGVRKLYEHLKLYPPTTTAQFILDDLREYSLFRGVL